MLVKTAQHDRYPLSSHPCCISFPSSHALTWETPEWGLSYAPRPKSMLQPEDQLRFSHAVSCQWKKRIYKLLPSRKSISLTEHDSSIWAVLWMVNEATQKKKKIKRTQKKKKSLETRWKTLRKHKVKKLKNHVHMVKKKKSKNKKINCWEVPILHSYSKQAQANYHWAMSPALLYNLLTDEI